ncbi:hypothetical protein P9222_08970 [Paenibacillus amylolyticus]|nr:hypothetical protein [Paenibacillus amylolyticus]WFR64281.1 hypothetical protein P9222_08970 [Paenibacillus amylolyticus]
MDINDYLRELNTSRTSAEQMDEYVKQIKRLRKRLRSTTKILLVE